MSSLTKNFLLFLLIIQTHCSHATIAEAKNILIFNASSEIGQAIATKLSNNNHKLLLTARNTEKTKNTIPLEFKQDTNLTHLSNPLKNKTIDGIVVITPRPEFSKIDSYGQPDSQAWRKCFEEGFIGPMEALNIAIPHLKQKGKIVIIGGLTSIQSLDSHQHFGVHLTYYKETLQHVCLIKFG